MGELADPEDLKSFAAKRPGSSPGEDTLETLTPNQMYEQINIVVGKHYYQWSFDFTIASYFSLMNDFTTKVNAGLINKGDLYNLKNLVNNLFAQHNLSPMGQNWL